MARQEAEQLADEARAERERQLRDAAAKRRSEARSERRERSREAGRSASFTLRLAHDELDALERRAARLGLTPSATARQLIRYGLSSGSGRGLPGMVSELEMLTVRLRESLS